ncbi:PAS domain S-box protein [Halococcus saccharolyticus]|uniref:histidine kinase n=1 Tax=Halococcus saccharolyticus DSM 5350 TaxID=1227455 RepID=M0MMX7_9EURY|nr:PAS domain S-box protein [Halococcus saccharolyticus]EMA46996.1 signal-transducing histidine kinase [Halococcus saccharolyticus DSM 5350]
MNGEIAVLLVDDEPAVADLAATHLERLRDGFDVTVVEGGKAALATFERDPTAFDCIVSDYTMPAMNGLDLLAAVREIDADRPFVLFTGKGSEEIASEAVSAGVTDYLQKETGTEQYELLANRIENAVEAHRAERRADELARINGVISDVQRELVRESTREGIEEQVCARLAQSTPYTLAWIGEPGDGDRVVINERAGSGTGYLDEITVRADDTPRGRGPAGRALRTGTVQTTRNLIEDETMEPWAATAERYGHESVIALPLSYDGVAYGVLVVYSSRQYAFGEEERTALAELAGTIGQAIHAAETRTELERRERELREERAVAEGIFDAMPDAIYAFDPAGQMLRWNDAFAATVGYDDETIAGMNALEFVPEADRDLIEDRIAAVVERGETVTVESAFVTSDGETIPHEFNGAPLTDSESVYGVIGSGRDITGRKRREAAITALHESTRDLVRADDRAGVATATIEAAAEVLGFSVTTVRLHDPDTDTLEPFAVSDAARRVLGERPSYAHGEALPWRALDSGEPVLTAGSVAEYGADDLPFGSAMYVPLGDHGTLSIGLSDDTFDDADIRLTQVLAANAAVALDRVDREARLQRHERMLDAAGDGIYALDTEGRFTSVNDTIVEKTGYAREELLGEHVSTFLEAADIEHGRDLIRDLLSRDSFGSVSESFEATVHPADGSTFPCEIQVALLPTTETEAFRGTVGVIRDSTERKQRERELERYETMVETAPVGMFVVNPDGTVVGGNERAGSMAGYPMAKLRGKPFRTLVENGIVPPESIEKYVAAVRDLLSADTERTTGTYELTITPPNGDRRTLRIRVSLLPYETEFEGTVMICEDVTERKQREHELEAARARFRALAENTTLAVVTIDENSTIRYANEAVQDVFGYAAAELKGESLTTVMPERLHDPHFTGLDRYLREGDKHLDWEWIELPGRHRDGREIQLGVSFGEHVAEGEHRFTATIRDITARKRHEAAIETLHNATRAMIDAADRDEIAEIAVATVERVLDMPMCGVWFHDESDAVLRPAAISERGADLFGTAPTYTGGESLSWQAFEDGETRRYDRVDREADVYDPETPLRSEIVVPIGEFGVLNIGSTEPAAFDDDDVSLAKLLATNTEAALSRADRERQLVDEHDRLGALFENVPDAALRYDLVDGEPIVRDVNTAFEEVFGYAADAVTGENIDEFIVPAGDDARAEADDLNERLLTGERLRTTARRQTVDGVRDFLLHVVPIELNERNAEGYSIYTDITDQQRRQRELERQNELLEEFASVISHDLRNPLSVARGRLELAREEHDSEHHEGIDAALIRMNELIEDVLTLARQGRVIGATERVSLAAVAERAWHTAGTESAELTIDDPGEVEADPDRLARLFENLFRNAVEHGSRNPPLHAQGDAVEHGSTSSRPEASDAVEHGSTSDRTSPDDATEHARDVAVTVGRLDDGGFFVADDGPGIPDGERENVFEGGYSTADDGTGLGLSIVRSIVEAHDWTVTAVESDTGGARFEVRTQTAEEKRK